MWTDHEWFSHKMLVGKLKYITHKINQEPTVNPYHENSELWKGYESERNYDLISKQFKEVMQ